MSKRFIYIFSLLFLLLNISVTSALCCIIPVLPPPQLRCVSVSTNGSVILTWAEVHDTLSSFNSYHIFSATNQAGPYTDIDSIFNITKTTYLDLTANANNGITYYYLETRSSCRGMVYSNPSDTLRTIHLNILNTGTAGTASLSWNSIHSPDLPTSVGWYHIYRKYPAGTWIMIDSTQSLHYIDTITVCHAFISYYVDIDDSLPCTSASSIDGAILEDKIAPVSPLIDSVSVDPANGYSVIGWTASPSADTKGYIIYEIRNGIRVTIDTVWGKNNTFYTNKQPHWSNPDSCSLTYCLAAFDSCKNASSIDSNQRTIFLRSVFDICGRTTTLNWASYINMPDSLMGYKIYVSQNNGPMTLLGINSPSNHTFTHTSLAKNSTYVYSIQAFNNISTITSTSNTNTVYAYAPVQPKFVYLRYATVVNSDYIEIKAFVDTSGYILLCKILRADDSISPFKYVGSVTPVAHSNSINFSDHSALVNTKSYYYKILVDDSCGNDVDTSNIGRSIFLQAHPTSNMKNILTWNEYEMWLGSVKSYDVFREMDGVWEANPIATLPPGTNTYTDNVSAFTTSDGKFVYLVVADEGTGNPYQFADTSASNEAISLQPPRLYIPNAFVPKGVNSIFMPENVFVNTENYEFNIYNSWGGLIFRTTDTNTGWDGTCKGTPVPLGVYVYVIRFENSGGQMMESSGTVTLIR